jgi:hypothetical protein
MKKALPLSVLMERVQKLAPAMAGVFSYGDLFNLIGAESPLRNQRTIRKLIREGMLFKIRRGIYTTQSPDLWVLGSRIKPNAYVSLESVLAANLLIGTVPRRSVSMVSTSPGRLTLETPVGTLRFFSVKKNLLFGFNRRVDGVRVADSEKAYIDLLYFYAKGARFVIDPLREVDIAKLDRARIRKYLRKYRNPRFVAFVERSLKHVD